MGADFALGFLWFCCWDSVRIPDGSFWGCRNFRVGADFRAEDTAEKRQIRGYLRMLPVLVIYVLDYFMPFLALNISVYSDCLFTLLWIWVNT